MQPNFFIVGITKGGTTSLYNYLDGHPQIYMSPLKETHYFDFSCFPADEKKPVTSREQYLRLFDGAGGQPAIGDNTPSYLFDPEAPGAMKQFQPDAKIIAILRDPVERAYSHYLQRTRNYKYAEFRELIQMSIRNIERGRIDNHNILFPGLYSRHIERYLQHFDRENVKIIFFEDFFDNPATTVKDILGFLGLDTTYEFVPENYNPYQHKQGANVLSRLILRHGGLRNAAGKVFRLLPDSIQDRLRQKHIVVEKSKPVMPGEERGFLQEYYRQDVERLNRVLDREPPWEWSRQ